MDAPAVDLDAYLRRIGFDSRPEPTLAVLAALVVRHAAAIPFENIEVLAGRVPRLDLASLQGKLVQRRRGGYCFEQNTLFMACLQAAGFAVRPLEGRVRAGVHAEVVTGRTHMALRVSVDGAEHLVDVGFGSLAPMAPLRLDRRDAQATPHGDCRLVDVGGELLLQAQTDQGWSDCYRIASSTPEAIDREIGNWYVATHPNALLGHNLLVSRSVAAGRLSLFNRQLSLRRMPNEPPEERTLDSREAFAGVLADDFGLAVDAADLDAVMALLAR